MSSRTTICVRCCCVLCTVVLTPRFTKVKRLFFHQTSFRVHRNVLTSRCQLSDVAEEHHVNDYVITYLCRWYPFGCSTRLDPCPSPSPSPSPRSSPTYYKTITPQSNTDLCLDLPGDSGQESQPWVFDNWQIRFGADVSECLDAKSMQDGIQSMLWSCEVEEVFLCEPVRVSPLV